MHTHFSKSNYKNFKVRHCSHMFPMTQIKTAFQAESAIVFKQLLLHSWQFLLLSVFNFLFHGFSEQISLFRLDISLCSQKLCTQYRTAGCAAQCVVGETYKLPIVNFVFSQTANRYAHALLIVDIQLYLRTIILFQILNELLRCARKLQFLRKSFEINQLLDQLLFGWFLSEL